MNFILDRKKFTEFQSAGNILGGHEPRPSTSMQDGGNRGVLPALNQKPQDPLASAILSVSDLTTKFCISHPCKVLRRQCQVHQNARSLHLTPITLIPVAYNITAKEGFLTLWKGSIGTAVLWVLNSATEVVLSDLLGLPRSYIVGGSTEKYWRHIALKAITALMLTPFYVSSFIETVRSESGLSGDDNRMMEVFVKAIDRMRYFVFSARDASRRFSVVHMAVPTVVFHTSNYVLHNILYQQLFKIARRYVLRKPESQRTKYHEYLPQIFAQMTSSIATDLILFPFETILHRIYIQGTRTLIDNLDTGLSAASMSLKYSGFFDCLRKTIQREGLWALYAGVGALLLEYALQTMLHQAVRACFDRGSEVLRQATQAHHLINTPPLSHASNLDAVGPLSGPLAAQNCEPQSDQKLEKTLVISPTRSLSVTAQAVPFPSKSSPPLISTSPPMARQRRPDPPPLTFPTFSETASTLKPYDYGVGAFGLPPYQPPKSSIFGSNPKPASTSSLASLDQQLRLDTNNQFN